MTRLCTIFWMWLAALPGLAAAQDFSALARTAPGSSLEDTWGGAELTLELTQGVPYRVFTVAGPPRLVLDFREVDWSGFDARALDRADRVAAVHVGRFKPGWSRMVLDLAVPLEVETAGMALREDGATLTLTLGETDAEAFAARAGAPRDATWGPAPVPQTPPAPNTGEIVVMIDPGHGGIDPGAEAGGVREADLTLILARALRDALRRTDGFDAVLTRDADVFVALERRVALAKAAGADLFVSLHADALKEGVARGATVYTLAAEASDAAAAALAERHERSDLLAGLDLAHTDDVVARVLMDLARLETTPRSRALAGQLVTAIRGAGARTHKRPLKAASFSVLKSADIPSVLVEVGYLSTPADLADMQDPAWRARMVRGLQSGIEAWALEDAALAPLRRK
ncbi:N-acetylmuramoyl-L-alanine amidase [Pseudaestuariivita sp.]|uniref:N-acetylmuramoyl-L-alanine amidase n=1 Tax=Pseudaestuariivita sp. TaxID=2211669 RepID=UPI0040583B62